MTHQEIMAGLEAIASKTDAEVAAVRDKAKVERAEFQRQCGQIGHLFGERNFSFFQRGCVVCGVPQLDPVPGS